MSSWRPARRSSTRRAAPDLARLHALRDPHWSVRSVLGLLDDEQDYRSLRAALAKPLPDRPGAAARS